MDFHFHSALLLIFCPNFTLISQNLLHLNFIKEIRQNKNEPRRTEMSQFTAEKQFVCCGAGSHGGKIREWQ